MFEKERAVETALDDIILFTPNGYETQMSATINSYQQEKQQKMRGFFSGYFKG
jgi:hypothetical protein